MQHTASAQLAQGERRCARRAPLADEGGTSESEDEDDDDDESMDEADVAAAANQGSWLGALQALEGVLAEAGTKAATNVAAEVLKVSVETKAPYVDEQLSLVIAPARVRAAERVSFQTEGRHSTSGRSARKEAYAPL